MCIRDRPYTYMLAFLRELETSLHNDMWGFTSLTSLVLASRDDHNSAVIRIEPIPNGYRIIYPDYPERKYEPRFFGPPHSQTLYFDNPKQAVAATLTLYDRILEESITTSVS